MSTLTQLAIMLGNVVTRSVDSKVFDWMMAVSGFLDQTTLLQTSWFIDPVNGNDSASGLTSSTAIKTDAERQRRWGFGPTVLTQPTTLTYLSSPPVTDIVNFDVIYENGASLNIVGIPTTSKASVPITAVTTLNRAANPPVPWDITGTGLDAADIGKIVTINQGARLNNYAVVLKDLGGGKVRVSPFGNNSITQTTTNTNSFVQVTPTNTDFVDVQVMPTIRVGVWKFRAGTPNIPTTTLGVNANCIFIDSCLLDGFTGGTVFSVGGTIEASGANVFYRRCILRRLRISGTGGQWVSGGAWQEIIHLQGIYSMNGGPFCAFNATAGLKGTASAGVFTIHPGGNCVFDGDCIWQECALFVFGSAYVAQFSVFDFTIADLAIQVFPMGVIRARTFVNASLIYGDNNTGVGMKVFSGGLVSYTVKPTINTAQGAGRQSLIGGANTDWAAVPVVTAANGAAIVVDA